MDDKHKGAWAEAVAKAYLLKMGFEVFANVSSHGIADIVVMDPDTGVTMKFDVKLASVRKGELVNGFRTSALRFQRTLNAYQENLGIQLLHVTPGGSVLSDAEIGSKDVL